MRDGTFLHHELHTRPLPLLLASIALAACADSSVAPREPGLVKTAQDLSTDAVNRDRRFLVMFKPTVTNVASEAQNKLARYGGRLLMMLQPAIPGFAAELTPAAVRALKADPSVAIVEPDGRVRGGWIQTPTPSWGLDRVDQHALPLSNFYNYAPTGAGVHIYIVDSGIQLSHPDFGGRADAVFDYDPNNPGGFGDDCHGHGTGVASVAGSNTFGVAKGVNLHAVRVLDCSYRYGNVMDVINGINWIINNHQSPAVANFSLTSDVFDPVLNTAVTNLIGAGVTAVVIAGNGTMNNFIAVDACTISPAATPAAITAGGTDITDAFSAFSNYGQCVDVAAPARQVSFDCLDPLVPSCTRDGTSFAAPATAGAAALYLETNPQATPA